MPGFHVRTNRVRASASALGLGGRVGGREARKRRAMADPYPHGKLTVRLKDMASTEIHLIFVLRAVLCKPRRPELICSR